jgi:adenylyltransferase/sulfurtransferase
MLSNEELLHYSKQILLPQIDISGQEALKKAHILIIGLGGLGSPVALYLASSGIGHLTLVDDDHVELSNLQRQIIHSMDELGEKKVRSAQNRLNRINPRCQIHTIQERLNTQTVIPWIQKADIVIDCSDNIETRLTMNHVCFNTQTPLISGSAIRFEGQLIVFTMQPHSPCYQCLYPSSLHIKSTCSTNGVLGPIVGVIGCLQALEAIKLITQPSLITPGQLTLFDGMTLSFQQLKLPQKKTCPICSQLPSLLSNIC